MVRIFSGADKNRMKRGWRTVVLLLLTMAVGVTPTGLYQADYSQVKVVTTSSVQQLDMGGALYLEQLIGEKLAISANTGRSIGRAEFAEVAVRLNLKLNGKTTEAILPRNLVADSQDLFVNEACNLHLMGVDQNNKFNPYGAITREQAAVVMDKVLKSTPARFSSRYNSLSGAAAKDLKSATPAFQQAVRNMIGNGILGSIKSNFRPKANLTVNEALQMTNLVADMMNKDGRFRGPLGDRVYPAIKIGKFMAPNPQKSDLLVFIPRNGAADLSMRFSGAFSNNRNTTPYGLHLQVATTVLSNSRFTRSDALSVLKVIGEGWDGTTRQYHFDHDIYIKSGSVLSNQPKYPFILIKAGATLDIDVHETR